MQIEGVAAVAGWSALATAGILLAIKYTMGLRVTPEEEAEGLDYSQHGEAVGADL